MSSIPNTSAGGQTLEPHTSSHINHADIYLQNVFQKIHDLYNIGAIDYTNADIIAAGS